MWYRLIFLVSVSIFLAGCIAIPLPPESHQYTETMEQQIVVGKTTRNEIIKSLGEPKLSQNDTLLIYRLPRETMKFLLIAGGPGAGWLGLIPYNRSDYVLLMKFDSAGILQKYEALINKSNAYDTIIQPPSPAITNLERSKLFGLDKHETDLFFFNRTLIVGFKKIALSSDGKTMLAIGNDHERTVDSMYLINLESNESKILQKDFSGRSIFSPDISKMARLQGTNMSVMETNTSIPIFKKDYGFWGMSVFTSAAFNSDGTLLATGDNDSNIVIYDVLNDKKLLAFKDEQGGWIDSVAFSTDGRWLATLSNGNNLKIWNTKTAILVDSQTAASGPLIFSPKGNIFAINSKDHVQLWQINEDIQPKLELLDIFTLPGQVWDSLPKLTHDSLAFSPNGKYVAARNGSLVVYDIPKQKKVLQYSKSIDNQLNFDPVLCVIFTSDGQSVIGGTERGIYTWHLTDESIILE